MKKFKFKTKCKKCDNANIAAIYVPGSKYRLDRWIAASATKGEQRDWPKGEFMLRVCRKCSFDWMEKL